MDANIPFFRYRKYANIRGRRAARQLLEDNNCSVEAATASFQSMSEPEKAEIVLSVLERNFPDGMRWGKIPEIRKPKYLEWLSSAMEEWLCGAAAASDCAVDEVYSQKPQNSHLCCN